jgi:GT2 family glycosyltransferase
LKTRVCLVVSSYNGRTVTYKGKPIIKLLLDSIKNISFSGYKTILTDDCSPDGTDEYVRKNYPHVDVLSHKKNVGYAKNNNSAIAYALKRYNPEYMVLLNDDVIARDRTWLSRLVELADGDARIGVEGCKLVYPDLKIQHAGISIKNLPKTRGRAETDNGQYDKIEDIDAVIGAVILIRREVIKKIGVLDDSCFRAPEDADYCLRASAAGYRVVYNGRVSLIHLEGHTLTFSKSQEMRDKIFCKRQEGRTYFAFKHHRGIRLLTTLAIILGGAFFTIESEDRQRKISSMRMNRRVFWRVSATVSAMASARKIYMESRSK